MPRSLIGEGDHSLWLHDDYVEIIAYHVYHTVDQLLKDQKIAPNHIDWFIEFNEYQSSFLQGFLAGGGSFYLKDVIKNDYLNAAFKAIFAEVKARLTSFGEEISIFHLNRIAQARWELESKSRQRKGYWMETVATQEIIGYIEVIEKNLAR